MATNEEIIRARCHREGLETENWKSYNWRSTEVVLMQELARADERAKVAEDIFNWLYNQPYFNTGDGEMIFWEKDGEPEVGRVKVALKIDDA